MLQKRRLTYGANVLAKFAACISCFGLGIFDTSWTIHSYSGTVSFDPGVQSARTREGRKSASWMLGRNAYVVTCESCRRDPISGKTPN